MAQLCNVYSSSSDAVKAILELHFPTGTILDVNYGLGVFYKKVDRKVVGVDIRDTGQIVADNKNLPFPDKSFDIGVCDPPYKRGDGYKYEGRYGKAPKTETQVTWDYEKTLTELIRVVRFGVIIKAQDGTDGHRFHPRLVAVVDHMRTITGLLPHDVCYVVRNGVPDNLVQGTQHFFKNRLSYFLIYKWMENGKPVRF